VALLLAPAFPFSLPRSQYETDHRLLRCLRCRRVCYRAFDRSGTARWTQPPRPNYGFTPSIAAISLVNGDVYRLYQALVAPQVSQMCRFDRITGVQERCINGSVSSPDYQIFSAAVLPAYDPLLPTFNDTRLNPCAQAIHSHPANDTDQSVLIAWIGEDPATHESEQSLERWCDTDPFGAHGWRADFNVSANGDIVYTPISHDVTRLIFWVRTPPRHSHPHAPATHAHSQEPV
jgi:hypothetical protein